MSAKQVWPSLPVPHPSINEVVEDQAPVEVPLLKDLIDLGTETTWSSFNTFPTHDSHGLGKLDLNSGGAGELVVEDWAAVDAPRPKDRAAVEAPPR